MLSVKRIATLGAITVAAIVPAAGAQAASASPHQSDLTLAKLCHPKWVLGPNATSNTHSVPSIGDFDVENQTASGEVEDIFATETVDYDDLSYNGC